MSPVGRRGSAVCVCVPYGAAEQNRILQDDGESRPEHLQGKLTDVDPVNDNPPCRTSPGPNHVIPDCFSYRLVQLNGRLFLETAGNRASLQCQV